MTSATSCNEGIANVSQTLQRCFMFYYYVLLLQLCDTMSKLYIPAIRQSYVIRKNAIKVCSSKGNQKLQ